MLLAKTNNNNQKNTPCIATPTGSETGNIALFHTAREPGTTRFSRTFSKWWILRVKTRTKAFFFEEILINFP